MKAEEWVNQITAQQWETLRGYLERETGMDFAGPRFSRLRSAVTKVLTLHPQWRLAGEHPEEQLPPALVELVTAELTVGESFFFRNHAHFDALRDHVLPAILAENAARREVRLWSAGCAAGEEPYSLAILLDQVLQGREPWHVSILGTDLNPEFLQRARQGWFRPWSFRHTQVHYDARYFRPRDGGYELSPRIREHVRFAYLNLVKDAFPSPLNGTVGMDLILFRNVAIYLKPEVTAVILRRFWDALRPGGWLLLGETELNQAEIAPFTVRRFASATFFQKSPSAQPSTLPALPRPALADAGGWQGITVPVVPPVPDWVPLPSAGGSQTLSSPPTPHVFGSESQVAAPSQIDAPRDRRAPVTATVAATSPGADLLAVADPRQRAQARLKLAHSLLLQAQTAEAKRQVELSLQEDPLLVEAYILQVGLAEDAGDLAAAEHACRRALYLDRRCCLAHFHLSLVQQQQGDVAGAAKSLRTVRELIEQRDPHELVEYGDGMCYGRLRELIQMLGLADQT